MNGVFARYLRGVNLILRRQDNLNQYYHFNAHGDVVQRTDYNGVALKNYDYDAFGVEKDLEPMDSNPFRYCGEYFDSSSGTYYLRNRHYNPAVGRFTQEDPIRSGLNWYSYCGGNPIMFVDPLGLLIQLQGKSEERQRILEQMRKLTDGTIEMDKKDFLSFTGAENSKTVKSNELIQGLIDSEYTNRIFESINDNHQVKPANGDWDSFLKTGSGGADIYFDPKSTHTLIMINPETGLAEERPCETYMFLAHEMIHAYRMNQGTFIPSKGKWERMETNKIPFEKGRIFTHYHHEAVNREEFATVGLMGYNESITENMLRQEHGLWIRASHGATFGYITGKKSYRSR